MVMVHTFWLGALAIASAAAAAAATQLVSNGLSVTLNDTAYFVSPHASGVVYFLASGLDHVPSVFGLKPVTVVQQDVVEGELDSLFSNWTSMDDVFCPDFDQAVFLAGLPYNTTSTSAGTRATFGLPDNSTVPEGPYFLEMASGKLYPVYRLYSDFAFAFAQALLQTPGNTFEPLAAQTGGSASLTVGVPSRLYFRKNATHPLAGVRVGVEDVYALAGARRSNGNRAWWNLYEASNVTAPVVRRLVDAGAVVVGLQKASQFVDGGPPWTDYQAPFNPRGDGHQASASGGAAAIASYSWLDVAVSTDSGGSVRGPARAQGLFGNRPSHGLVSLEGVTPLAPALDTAGVLLRDVHLWDAVHAAMYAENYTSLAGVEVPRYPQTIHTVGVPASRDDSPAAPLLLDLIGNLSALVNGSAVPLDLEAAWASSRPPRAGNVTLETYLNTTCAVLAAKEQASLVRDPFYADYAEAHGGRRPHVDAAPLARWAYGDSLPPSALDDAREQMAVFASWFHDAVLGSANDAVNCSSGLLVYVGTDDATAPWGFDARTASALAGAPDAVWPLGEVQAPAVSIVTGHREPLPVTVDVVAAKGCDGVLVRLARELVDRGFVVWPSTGRSVGAGGDVLM